jgi:hypothetical protein
MLIIRREKKPFGLNRSLTSLEMEIGRPGRLARSHTDDENRNGTKVIPIASYLSSELRMGTPALPKQVEDFIR